MTENKEADFEQTYTASGAFFLGLISLFLMTLLFAIPFMYVWNNVIIEVITICKETTYWQSFGMLLFIFFIGRIFNLNHNIKK